MTVTPEHLPYPIGTIDADGLDEVEALVADAAAVEGVGNVHEGGSYYAERIIRRAIEQGTLTLAMEKAREPLADVERVARALMDADGVPESRVRASWSRYERLANAAMIARACTVTDEGGRVKAALISCAKLQEERGRGTDWDELARAALSAMPGDGVREALADTVEMHRAFIKQKPHLVAEAMESLLGTLELHLEARTILTGEGEVSGG